MKGGDTRRERKRERNLKRGREGGREGERERFTCAVRVRAADGEAAGNDAGRASRVRITSIQFVLANALKLTACDRVFVVVVHLSVCLCHS